MSHCCSTANAQRPNFFFLYIHIYFLRSPSMRVVSSCSRARLLSSMHADPTGISFYSVLSTCGLVRCLSTHPGPLGPMVDLVPESDNTAQHTRTEDVTTIADRTTGTHRPAERANLQLATGRQLANTNPRHLVMQGRDSPPPPSGPKSPPSLPVKQLWCSLVSLRRRSTACSHDVNRTPQR